MPLIPGMTLEYSQLNEIEDEIRSISISPYVARSSLISCTLHTVSLRSFTPEYKRFLAGSSPAGRKRVADWNIYKTYASTESQSEPMLDTNELINSRHRFAWGDYAALSYVWGDPGETTPILLNGQEVSVQRNLEGALRVLSERAEFAGRYQLWVDAVCINQANSKERSSQIRKMKSIYGNALAVVAWLGPESEHSDKAIALLKVLSEAGTKECGELLEERLQEDPEYLGFGGFMALHDFMDRTYWYRLWIIQEIILGASSVVLRCGSHSISWHTFCNGVNFLFAHLWTAKDSIFAREVHLHYPGQGILNSWSTSSLHLVFRDLWGLSRNEEIAGNDYLSFGQLLDLAKPGDCQDSRDKVYGLVGIMEPSIAESISPDYTLSPSQVYEAITRTFIFVHGNLEPLREGNPWGDQKSPSWAADWTWNGRMRHGRATANIWGPYWRPQGQPPVSRLPVPYRASGTMKMELSFSIDGDYLTCRGFIVDEIDGLAAREEGYFDWAPHTIHQPTSGKNAYSTPKVTVEALWRCLVADRVAGGVKADEHHSTILNMPSRFAIGLPQFERLGWGWLSKQKGYYFRWSGWRRANTNFQLFNKPLDQYFKEKIPDNASEFDYTEAYSCNNRTGQGRRFLTTMEGYLGWGPDNMYGGEEDQIKAGDKIAILFGCSTPIVIRPHGKYFQILGEAYIQGLMDGEALDSLKSGEVEATFFTFC